MKRQLTFVWLALASALTLITFASTLASATLGNYPNTTHIEWDTAAYGVGRGTAIIQVTPNKTVCQITDKKMTDNTCSCSNAPTGSKQG